MNDITLRSGGETVGLSVEAAGALLAQLVSDAPDAVARAIAAIPVREEAAEPATVAAQLGRLAALANARETGPGVLYEPKPPARHLRFQQRPLDDRAGYVASSLVQGSPAMWFSFQAEELDGTHWGVETRDEETASAIARALLPMITDRKPLAWVKDEVRKLERADDDSD